MICTFDIYWHIWKSSEQSKSSFGLRSFSPSRWPSSRLAQDISMWQAVFKRIVRMARSLSPHQMPPAHVQVADLSHLLWGQFKVPDLVIGLDSGRCHRFGDQTASCLQVPADDNVGWRLAILGSHFQKGRMGQDFIACRRRAGCNRALLQPRTVSWAQSTVGLKSRWV